ALLPRAGKPASGLRHVDDDVEPHQLGTRGNRLLALACVCRSGITVAPRGVGLLVGPPGHDEVTPLALGRPPPLEPLETRRRVHGALALGEAPLELLVRLLRDTDGVDLHDAHGPTVSPTTWADHVVGDTRPHVSAATSAA